MTYSVVPRVDPRDISAEMTYYARAQARGEVTLGDMARRIQRRCTVTRADTMAVLISLGTVMRDGLCAGEIVRLGDLGSFQIGLNGEGSATEEEYHTGLIKKAHINCRPGADLSDILTPLRYERVPVKPKKEE